MHRLIVKEESRPGCLLRNREESGSALFTMRGEIHSSERRSPPLPPVTGDTSTSGNWRRPHLNLHSAATIKPLPLFSGDRRASVNAQQLSEGWEAINRAIDEKKAQLQKNNSNKRNSSESTVKGWEATNRAIDEKKTQHLDKRNSSRSNATGPWSYKALRRNALGPTLAMLRSSDGDLI